MERGIVWRQIMMTGGMLVVAVALTFTMFYKRNMLLEFPSGMFWALTGGTPKP